MALRAAAFINWTIPIGLGHVGWGFEDSPNVWYYGALETAGLIKGKNTDNGTFNDKGSGAQMIDAMRNAKRAGGGTGFPYHEYKMITVPNTNVGAALQLIERIKKNGYGLYKNNCLDATFNVVKAYACGNDRVLPWPATNPIPRFWYRAIPSQGIFIQSEASTGNWFAQHGNG